MESAIDVSSFSSKSKTKLRVTIKTTKQLNGAMFLQQIVYSQRELNEIDAINSLPDSNDRKIKSKRANGIKCKWN